MLLVSTVQAEVFETLLCFEQRLRPGYSMIITKTWEWTTDIICKGIESAEVLEAKMASVWEEIPAVCKRPDAEWQASVSAPAELRRDRKVCRSEEGKEGQK